MNSEAVLAQYGSEIANYVHMIIEETMGTNGLDMYNGVEGIDYEIIEDIVNDYFNQ